MKQKSVRQLASEMMVIEAQNAWVEYAACVYHGVGACEYIRIRIASVDE